MKSEREEANNSNAILIAASPSVFDTSFTKQKAAPVPTERIETRQVTRSKSVSNSIPMFQYQGPEIPKVGRNGSRGRQAATTTKRTELVDSRSTSKSEGKANTASTVTHGSVHPEIQALLITEDEAFGYVPRPASRAESRGRRRASSNRREGDDGRRRGYSAGREGVMSPEDVISPVSI